MDFNSGTNVGRELAINIDFRAKFSGPFSKENVCPLKESYTTHSRLTEYQHQINNIPINVASCQLQFPFVLLQVKLNLKDVFITFTIVLQNLELR
jgi:hypothetical protein